MKCLGVRPIVKIEVGSTLHELCCWPLENRHTFRKHRKVIRKTIVKNITHCSSNKFVAMGNHACFEIVLKDVTKQMVIDKHDMKSSVIARRLIKGSIWIEKRLSLSMFIWMKFFKTIYNQQWTKQCMSSVQVRSEAIVCIFLSRAVRSRVDTFEPALSPFIWFLFVVVMILCSISRLCFIDKILTALRLGVKLQPSP